jgi:hypothetical protein
MRANKLILSIALAFATALALASGIAAYAAHSSAHSSAHVATQDPLQAAHAATARFHALSVATRNGYTVLKDSAGITCIDNPGIGAMGIHFVNGTLVNSGQINPQKPQALVYEPGANGQMQLVALEYVVFQQQWDATHSSQPVLFGQPFMLTPDGNRFGLPAFYSLHAWIWKDNPTGMFSMWNPDVSCAAATMGARVHPATPASPSTPLPTGERPNGHQLGGPRH